MLAGLMSRCTSPQDSASLSEWHTCRRTNTARSLGQRAVPPHQRVGVEAVQQLHHEVERAVVGDAEVEQLHRVRRAEPRDGLRLLLEAALLLLRRGAAADAAGG